MSKTRREFLEGAGAALVVASSLDAQSPAPPAAAKTAIRLNVNGEEHRIEVEDRWTLVETLRDHLKLTGTKVGCDRGECGACTVLVDGKSMYSCSQLAVWMDGRSIETVEGLAKNGQLDPLQKSFMEHDAPQCGFCTSGQLMSAKAVLRKNPTPSKVEVRAGLTGNLCRCSNYQRYVEATVASATGAAPVNGQMDSSNVPLRNAVGHSTTRIDAQERVTGKATYTLDVSLPGMLYAKVLRSPHPHARIKHIDVSKAETLPGVKAIVTTENAAVTWGAGSIAGGVQYNPQMKLITKQRRYAFNNPVRFVGEPVAAVAATDRHLAEEALRHIEVEYEILPHVLDQEEAMKPTAPKIWPDGNVSLDTKNEPKPMTQARGDTVDALAKSAHVFAGRYTTTFVHNAQMEPRSCVAAWDGDKLTVYTPTGGIANCRTDMARDLGIPEKNVRVVCQYMGGNFGNKNQNQDADLIAAVLAQMAGHPVKLEFSRKEDFIGVHGRWPTTQYYKVGVTPDGELTAIEQRAYSGMGGYRKNSGRVAGVEIYQCPNIDSAVYPVYTNKTTSANFRGPEFPQGFFGIQSMMDDVAFQLKMDPVEFALKNRSRKADDQDEYTDYSLEECIRRGAQQFNWKSRWKPVPGADKGPIKRGAGFAFLVFRSGVGRSNAIAEVDSAGRYTIYVGVTDVGGGAKTTMGIIAAEELGVPATRVRIVWGDTDRCPYSVGESGSRTTIMTGEAVMAAARELKQKIAIRGLPNGRDVISVSSNPNPSVKDGKVRATYGAHFVEVETDIETGHTRVTKYVAVHDCGRIMNPLSATGQIRGGAIMGIGMALHEDLLYDPKSGQPLTARFYFDRIATHMDAPEIEVLFLESDDSYGPFGAKSMGEAGKIPAVAAVANAVFNATGRRMRDLPITRERILA